MRVNENLIILEKYDFRSVKRLMFNKTNEHLIFLDYRSERLNLRIGAYHANITNFLSSSFSLPLSPTYITIPATI